MSTQETMSVAAAPAAVPAMNAFSIFNKSRKLADTPFVNLKCINPECNSWYTAHIDEVLAGMYQLQTPCEFCGSPVVFREHQESGLTLEQTITKLKKFGLSYQEKTQASSHHDFAWESHVDLLLAPEYEVV